MSTIVIGPRTTERLEGSLAAADLALSTEVLDRIDAIVPPAATVDVADTLWVHGTRALDATNRRR